MKNVYKGKLSYTVAVVAVVWGIVGLVTQWLSVVEAGQAIAAGLAVFGIRRAI